MSVRKLQNFGDGAPRDRGEHEFLRGFVTRRVPGFGLSCRAEDLDAPVIQISPPQVADRTALGEADRHPDRMLAEAAKRTAA